MAVCLQSAGAMRRCFCSFLMLVTAGCEAMAPMQPRDDVDSRPPDLDRGLVAMGVARLSTRHAAALLAAIDADVTCGFASAASKASQTVSGQPGDDGTATWSVKDCTLQFDGEQKLDTDCDGVELWVGGAVTLSATKTVHGVLTSDASQPLAPDSAEAAMLQVSATFDHFSVRDSNSDSAMTVNSGSVSFTALPRLAVSQSVGLCTVATPQLKLEALTLTDADVEITTRGHLLHPTVPSAHLSAQIGAGASGENAISGEVTVWETAVAIPIPSDRDGLDPSYDATRFLHSFQCRADLQLPVSHLCPPPRERPAQGAAALSVKLFGVIARQIENDTSCGFSSPSVKRAMALSAAIGSKGTGTYTLPAPCTLVFPPGTVVERDCAGAETMLEGSVAVTGVERVMGYLTGDPAEPVVPTSTGPVALELTFVANQLKLSQSGSTNTLLMKAGSISGTLEPKTGLDKASRACSIATPVAHVTLSHHDAEVEVVSGSVGVPLVMHTSSLEAQSGTANGKTNYLAGSVVAAGQTLAVPSANATPALDPSFDPVAFDASYRCNAALEIPPDEAACSFAQPLAEGAARLLVQDAAAVVKLVNDNGSCGFQNEDLLKNPYLVIGDVGQLGSMGWATTCTVGVGARQNYAQDCSNDVTTVEGAAAVQVARVVDGVRDEQCGGFLDLFCADTIIPIKPDAVVFNVASARLTNFGVGNDEGRLIIQSGTMAGVAKPMQGRRRSNGHFDVGTPVGRFDGLSLTGANVTLQSAAKTFTFAIAAASVSAFAGAYAGQRNALSGTVSVDGVVVTLGTMDLQPNYSQATFDQSYACTPDLTATLAP